MRYSSYLTLALAALMQASITAALPSGNIECPGPPSVLRALQPELCPLRACTTAADCCVCYLCDAAGSCIL
ncbi:hypothetical protein FB451DRAFT_1227012 [Mycena latifolia]|nr:hypothetical protein FB451DRAFT_1227012 [Mycena latifolia]